MFHQIVSIFALATVATAWTIPADQPNGVYSAFTNETGHTVHQFIQELEATPPSFSLVSRSSKARRTLSGTSSNFLKENKERKRKRRMVIVLVFQLDSN
jgi:hypothetical protein